MTSSVIEESENALRRAFNLGQTYWQQADSDYTSQHRKSEVTMAKFEELVSCAIADLRAALAELPKSHTLDAIRLDWLEAAYTRGGMEGHRYEWHDFMTNVAHKGYRAAIDLAMQSDPVHLAAGETTRTSGDALGSAPSDGGEG